MPLVLLREHLLNYRKGRDSPLPISELCKGTKISPQSWANWEVGRHLPDSESIEMVSSLTGDSVPFLEGMAEEQRIAIRAAKDGLKRWIRHHLERHGQSMAEAAEMMGVKRDTFRKWGRVPPGVESAYRLANWAGEIPPEHVSKAFGWNMGHGFGDGLAGPNRKVGPGARPMSDEVIGTLPWKHALAVPGVGVVLVFLDDDADRERVVEAMEMIRGVSAVVMR